MIEGTCTGTHRKISALLMVHVCVLRKWGCCSCRCLRRAAAHMHSIILS